MISVSGFLCIDLKLALCLGFLCSHVYYDVLLLFIIIALTSTIVFFFLSMDVNGHESLNIVQNSSTEEKGSKWWENVLIFFCSWIVHSQSLITVLGYLFSDYIVFDCCIYLYLGTMVIQNPGRKNRPVKQISFFFLKSLCSVESLFCNIICR